MHDEFVQKWTSQVKKGTLSFILLQILKEKKLYGYELITAMRDQVKIELAEGTLYPLMNRLKKEGLVDAQWVEQESGIPRKYYHLTKTGEATLEAMKVYWNEMSTSINRLLQ
ncbi:MAG: PadR family transcriptional regulator [Bacteroidota bacterium]